MNPKNHPETCFGSNLRLSGENRSKPSKLARVAAFATCLFWGTAHAGTYITGLSLDVAADNTVTVNNTGSSAFSNDSVGTAGDYSYMNGWGWSSGSILWKDTNNNDTLRIDDSGVDVLNSNGIANSNGSKSGSVQLTGDSTLGAALRSAYGSGDGIPFTSVIAQGSVDFIVSGTVNIEPLPGTIVYQKAVGTGNPNEPDQGFTLNIQDSQNQVISGLPDVKPGTGPFGNGGLTPGSYSVHEVNIPAGWELTDISCDSEGDSTFGTFTAGDTSISVELAGGDVVVCTFTNDYFEADLSITKEDDIDPVVAGGDPFSYTITVENDGPATAKNVVVTDTLPLGLTLVSTSGCAEDPAGVPTCSLGDIASESDASFTVTVTADDDVSDGDELINTVSVTSSTFDPNNGNDSSSEGTTVTREVDVAVTKTCSTNVVAGSGVNNYQCTIEVINNGPSQASNVVISDTFAAIAGVSDASLLLAPSLGIAGIAAGQLTWTIATLDPGANSSLPLVRTVSLAAAEGSPLISNTATITADETDTNNGNDSSTSNTDVRWPVATFNVSKVYESGGAGPVNVTLDCTDSTGLLVYDPQMGTTDTALTVRRFDFDLNTTAGTTCTITEEVPAGYYEVDRTDGCDVNPIGDEGDYDCTITNAVTRATFEVTKIYADGNDVDEVLVSIDCNTGLILDQDKLLSDGESVEFVVTSFTEGTLNCTITEDGESGYSGEYNNISLQVINDESCEYTQVGGGDEYECEITNTPDPVQIQVFKDWVFTGNNAPDIDTFIAVEIGCESEFAGPPVCSTIGPASGGPYEGVSGTNGYPYYQICAGPTGLNDVTMVVQVIPNFPSTECRVTEYFFDQSIEQENGCGTFDVSVNNGKTCTITNTVFFEGIPTLSQYGIALMALLMLGVGMVGFRRFT